METIVSYCKRPGQNYNISKHFGNLSWFSIMSCLIFFFVFSFSLQFVCVGEGVVCTSYVCGLKHGSLSRCADFSSLIRREKEPRL